MTCRFSEDWRQRTVCVRFRVKARGQVLELGLATDVAVARLCHGCSVAIVG